MLERIKNEPVVVIAVLLSVANLAFGVNPDVVADILETAGLLVGAAIARSKVSPTNA